MENPPNLNFWTELNMGECWNLDEPLKVAPMDQLLLEKPELRAMASYFRTFHGADSFVTALSHARALSEAGEIQNAAVWNQIAEEISQMETHDALQRCLKRQE
jgi:hypothetical protein